MQGDTRLRAPYVDTLRVPLRPARIPSWGRSCMQDEGLGGVPVHLPMVTAHGTALRVPYMKSLKGPLRVVLFFCYSSQTYSSSRVTPWVLLWGDLESFPRASWERHAG